MLGIQTISYVMAQAEVESIAPDASEGGVKRSLARHVTRAGFLYLVFCMHAVCSVRAVQGGEIVAPVIAPLRLP